MKVCRGRRLTVVNPTGDAIGFAFPIFIPGLAMTLLDKTMRTLTLFQVSQVCRHAFEARDFAKGDVRMRQNSLFVFQAIVLVSAISCGSDNSSNKTDSQTDATVSGDAQTTADSALKEAAVDSGSDSTAADTGADTTIPDTNKVDTGADVTIADTNKPDSAADSSPMDAGADTVAADTSVPKPDVNSQCSNGTAQTGDVTVSLSSQQQKISGFGVSSAWAGNYNNASDPTYLWNTSTGAGLTLLRIRYGDGLTIAKSAASYPDVKVWMTIWGTGTNGNQGGTNTSNQNNPNGCTCTGASNSCNPSMPVLTNLPGEASDIVSFVNNAKTNGVPIYAVSGANEPDSCGINSTSSYSPAELATWIDTLGPAMTNIGVKNMAPETMNGYGFPSYFTAIQNNTAAWNAVDIFASHEYGLAPPVQPAIAAAGKEYWETEVDTGTANGDPTGDGIASALLMAQAIHSDLTTRNLNAWHLWWLYENGNSGGCLYDTNSKVWTKRLWVMGNFSRFVRPGYMRVSTSGTVPSGVQLSAYTNPADGTVVVVAINNNTSATNLSVFLSGAAPCSMTPWVTSSSDSLASKSTVTVSGARFTFSLGAQSVTSFVGTP
jgi:glucuronoarabinoxylan endo-1,4-beta-xylanase